MFPLGPYGSTTYDSVRCKLVDYDLNFLPPLDPVQRHYRISRPQERLLIDRLQKNQALRLVMFLHYSLLVECYYDGTTVTYFQGKKSTSFNKFSFDNSELVQLDELQLEMPSLFLIPESRNKILLEDYSLVFDGFQFQKR